jgi:hypothetical protein
MCACTETDVRESANDCTLASGEGHSSRGETFKPQSPVSSSAERTMLHKEDGIRLNICAYYSWEIVLNVGLVAAFRYLQERKGFREKAG